MKINYTDADGCIIEVEVTEEVGSFYITSIEAENKNDRAETRRHTQLSTFEYEDARFFDSGIDISHSLAESDAVKRAMAKLSERQRHLITMIYIEGWSFSELARVEGRDESTIRKATNVAIEKFKKFYS